MKTVLNNLKTPNSQRWATNSSLEQGKVAKKDIWFVINARGLFRSISPSLLDYLDGMDPQFFETVLSEKSGKNGLPSPVDYLTEMIQLERDSVFVNNIIKADGPEISGAHWHIIADGPHLKFTLSEAPSTTEAGERRAS